MCWIFGYFGSTSAPIAGMKNNAQTILLHGLERLEYRGYDSAGMYLGNTSGQSALIKAIGKVANLASKLEAEPQKLKAESRDFGIAHTRWATHGGVSEENTHPHHDMNNHFYVVHNGIIENYHQLKLELLAKGYTFYGQTDTEVVANVLEDLWDGNFLSTVQKMLKKIRGAYALLILSPLAPNEIIAVRFWSPLLFASDKDQNFYFSSDKQALSGYVEDVIFLEDGDILHVHGKDYTVIVNGIETTRDIEKMDVNALEISKGNYKHFMLKEIFEQPTIIRRVFKGRVNFDEMFLNAEAFHGMCNEQFKKIVFIGCGTSYNAWCLGVQFMQDIAGIEAVSYIASEYAYQPQFVNEQTLFVFLSQSGETADSVEVLKMLKEKNAHTFGIVNVVGSTISRLTEYGLFTRAGAEIWVASTKAFTSQITCILLLALFLGKKRGLTRARYECLLSELYCIPGLINQLLDTHEDIQQLARKLAQCSDFFFLWRQYQAPIACESSLKFKEITYLHSEFYPTGELKHGPLALIDEKIPSLFFIPNDLLFEKNLSSLQEVKARKGIVVAISDQEVQHADYQIMIPETVDEFYPFLTAVVGQLLAYYTADILGKDIDKPRNLAKSVTVK